MEDTELTVGIDVGTRNVRVIIGESRRDSLEIEVVGACSVPSTGIEAGVIRNVGRTTEDIVRAISDAEKMAGLAISSVWVSISAEHVSSRPNSARVKISQSEVDDLDVERVLEQASTQCSPSDLIVSTFPTEFLVDEVGTRDDPRGMCGGVLESRVQLISGDKTAIQTLVKCIKAAGLGVDGIIFSPFAGARASLHRDEEELGVAVVDIGAGVTDLVISHEGALVHTAVLPIGGDYITRDIHLGLRTPQHEAERLKIHHGEALQANVDESETVDVPGVGGRPPRTEKRMELVSIIEARALEIMTYVADNLLSSGYRDRLHGGVVLIGGTAEMSGFDDLATQVLRDRLGVPDLQVRRGYPLGITGMVDLCRSPANCTSVGLLKCATDLDLARCFYLAPEEAEPSVARSMRVRTAGGGGGAGQRGLFGRFFGWFRAAFFPD